MSDHPLRKLPPVHELIADPSLRDHPRDAVLAAVRDELDAVRNLPPPIAVIDTEAILARIGNRLRAESVPRLRTVINATGVILHTNLGRSPVAEVAAEAASRAASGYLNLEMDLASGKRSSRQNPIREAICPLLKCESATAVNNCAAATVITLRALAAGKEVIVSRGQLIEIGGSFRIPEIMQVSGATLREVGTTNITRASDYERAITPNTGLLMRVHTSNYRISGFTEETSLPELVALGKKHNLPVVDDVGSGSLIDLSPWGLTGEPHVPRSIEQGADLVLFSGDKLLGGPQAGLICGKKQWVDRIERDPLMRAFRLDKMSLAALEATLKLYRDSDRVMRTIPTLRMISATRDQLRPRCERLRDELLKLPAVASAEIRDEVTYVGGGSLPDQAIPTLVVAVTVKHLSEGEFAARLRENIPAVLVRVQDGKVLLDLRTVFEAQEAMLVGAVQSAIR